MKLLLAIVLVACGSTTPQPEPVARHDGTAGASAPVPSPAAPAAPEAARLELVEGTPTTLSDGTIVNIKGVMYAHLTESRNLSRCTLVLTRGAETKEVGLERQHGQAMPSETPGEAFGWQFSIVMADPYQQPSRATVDAHRP